MHKLNIFIFGPDSFISTFNELKTYFKFNISSNQKKLTSSFINNLHGIIYHQDTSHDDGLKDILQKYNCLKILAADNNPAMQKILSALLQPLGHDITIVGDGQAAVAAAATQDFDVILMDVMMPVMDGPTAARSIRQMGGRGGSVPIIAITANAMTGDREGYLSAGITDYLSKPIEVPLLLEALSRAAMATGKA